MFRMVIRDNYYLLLDILTWHRWRKDKESPPPRLARVVGGSTAFKAAGEEFFKYFVELAHLKPDEKVLDVGSGVGRMAMPLTKYLDENGSYSGFDIYPAGIEWCKKNISRRYPNFRFEITDIYNNKYNPAGKHRASDYRFPYENESFDLVFLTSVFTHLLPDDMEHYLSEIARVLKKKGRCLISFFLLNKESIDLIETGETTIPFKHEFGKFRVKNPRIMEAAVAYEESFILELYERNGLAVQPPIHYGRWCNRTHHMSYQDIIVASKGGHGADKERS